MQKRQPITTKRAKPAVKKKLSKPVATIEKKASKQLVAYVFQGGGALGAYQVGAYKALREAGYIPDIVVGISIGAINAAILAGNKREDRLDRLNQFWDNMTTKMPFPMFSNYGLSKFHHFWSAAASLMIGQPGFFTPKALNPNLIPNASPEELSYYDTTPLRKTLIDLIDFNYLNEKHVRLCLGSVELDSGEFVFFDSFEQEILPEHIMASGALPPGFPPVKIGDKYYVDGGVFSNTPISKIFDEFADSEKHIKHILCFMIDLFSIKGPLPHSMDGMLERIKDIRYSSHTKRASSMYATAQNLSHAIHYLSSKLTPEQKADPHVQKIMKLGYAHRLDMVHLVYHSEKGTELESKDYEFSAESADKHRIMGYTNTKNMIEREEAHWLNLRHSGVTLFAQDLDKTSSQRIK